MSSPHVAGVVACWLEADSSLTVQDVIEIAQSTASTDYPDFPNSQWGAGNIEAYAGLKEVLKRGGVGDVLVDAEINPIFTYIGERQFVVEVPQCEIESVEVYSTDGKKVLLSSTSYVDMSVSAPGVYIIKVKHSKGTSLELILIK